MILGNPYFQDVIVTAIAHTISLMALIHITKKFHFHFFYCSLSVVSKKNIDTSFVHPTIHVL